MSQDSGVAEETLFELRVRTSLDVYPIRNAVRDRAEAMGFDRVASSELVIAASELTTNIVKYGISGALTAKRIAPPSLGLLLIATDIGPPFHDFATALRDHHDDHGLLDVDARRSHRGLASGLGAVVRFTDFIEHEPRPVGKAIRAGRYLRPLSVTSRAITR